MYLARYKKKHTNSQSQCLICQKYRLVVFYSDCNWIVVVSRNKRENRYYCQMKRIVHEKAWVSLASWHHHGTYIVNGSAIQAFPTKFLELWAVWQLSVWAKIQSSQAHAILKITWKLRPLHKSQYNNTTPINTNMGTTYRVGKELKPP